jgi:hypothetical protein
VGEVLRAASRFYPFLSPSLLSELGNCLIGHLQKTAWGRSVSLKCAHRRTSFSSQPCFLLLCNLSQAAYSKAPDTNAVSQGFKAIRHVKLSRAHYKHSASINTTAPDPGRVIVIQGAPFFTQRCQIFGQRTNSESCPTELK